MKRILLPYEEEVINQIHGVDPLTEHYPSYTLEWFNKSLNKNRLQKKFGEDWDAFPDEVKDFYRAEGFRSAALAMKEIILREKQLPCELYEIIAQDILRKLEEVVIKEVSIALKEIKLKSEKETL